MKKLFSKIIITAALLLSFTSPAQAAGLMDSAWPIFHGNAKLTGQSPYDTSKVDGSCSQSLPKMQQIDMTSDEVTWAKENCPETYWIGTGEVGQPGL